MADNDTAAHLFVIEVDAQCEACGAVSTITLSTMDGSKMDACGSVCECGEVKWLVRFYAHPEAEGFRGGGVA